MTYGPRDERERFRGRARSRSTQSAERGNSLRSRACLSDVAAFANRKAGPDGVERWKALLADLPRA